MHASSNVTHYGTAMDSPQYWLFTDETASANVTAAPPNIFTTHDWVSFMQEFCPLAYHVDRIVTVIWYIIGLTGNLLSAKIWLEKRMRKNNSSAIYLATLSISDLIFLMLHPLQESQYAWGKTTLDHPGLCEIYFMLILFAQYLSPILVLAFTVERWIAVCHPFVKERYCTTGRAVRVVAGLVFGCLLLGSMQAYLWHYSHGQCRVRHSAMEESSLWSVWTWTTETLVFFVVPTIIFIFNVLVIREIRKLSRNGENMMPSNEPRRLTCAATTFMLLCVSFYVIITVLPAAIVYAITDVFPMGNYYMTPEQIRHDPTWRRYLTYITVRKIIEEICISHYACNFFLYILTGPQFRKSCCRLAARVMPKKYCHIFLHDGSLTSNNSVGTQRTSLPTNRLMSKNSYTPVAANGRDVSRM